LMLSAKTGASAVAMTLRILSRACSIGKKCDSVGAALGRRASKNPKWGKSPAMAGSIRSGSP